MTHSEFRLTVKQDIIERVDSTLSSVHYKIGDTITVSEDTFLKLQSGKVITQHTRWGMIEYDKYNFENEVSCTMVTVEYSIRKLGQRNKEK